MRGVFLSVHRYVWCAPLSHPSFCMLVNHGPSQESSKEEYKPWKWGATARFLHISYRDHITNEEVRAKIQQAIGPHDDLLTIVKRRKYSGMDMFPVHQIWPKPPCKAQWKGEKTRQTAEEMGRHQGMDRPGVRQVPEGSGEQGKMEETGCKIIHGTSTTLAVKG